jgi:hypothetical protein
MSTNLVARCPSCRTTVSAPVALAGQTTRCGQCGENYTLPKFEPDRARGARGVPTGGGSRAPAIAMLLVGLVLGGAGGATALYFAMAKSPEPAAAPVAAAPVEVPKAAPKAEVPPAPKIAPKVEPPKVWTKEECLAAVKKYAEELKPEDVAKARSRMTIEEQIAAERFLAINKDGELTTSPEITGQTNFLFQHGLQNLFYRSDIKRVLSSALYNEVISCCWEKCAELRNPDSIIRATKYYCRNPPGEFEVLAMENNFRGAPDRVTTRVFWESLTGRTWDDLNK